MLKHYDIGTFQKCVIDGCITYTEPAKTDFIKVRATQLGEEEIKELLLTSVKDAVNKHWFGYSYPFIVGRLPKITQSGTKLSYTYIHINVYGMNNLMLDNIKADDFKSIVRDALSA